MFNTSSLASQTIFIIAQPSEVEFPAAKTCLCHSEGLKR